MNEVSLVDERTGRTVPRFWDGRARSYVPPAELSIDSSLQLHTEATATVDPITLEVVRYSLLHLNFEHASLLCRLAISPAVMVTRDMQTSLLTEVGELAFMGPGLQYFATASSLIVKWTLENRAASPGIHPGDMFICNDPYVGSPHQPDTCILAPIFVDGALWGWVTNTMHHLDLGGIEPGSMSERAVDIYQEGICLPPTKIVSGGVTNEDVVELFVRSSRLFPMVGMDLRSTIAACERSCQQVLALIDKYGASVVKAVMRRTLAAAATVFAERLDMIPDGHWTHRVYAETCRPGDDGVYRLQVGITKEGGSLIVDNHGTDPQAGSLNCAFGAFSGAVLAAITANLVSDLAGSYGGIYPLVHFDLEPGLLNCPEYPAAVAPVGSRNAMVNLNAAAVAIGKMMSCGSDEIRRRALGPSTPYFYGMVCGGAHHDGGPFMMVDADGMMGSLGARPIADGVDAGGHFWIPEGIGANVEHNEQRNPVVALYRRLVPGTEAGAGRFRGGRGVEVAYALHGAAQGSIFSYKNEQIPKSQGQWGGNPGSIGPTRVKTAAKTEASFAAGNVPQDFDVLEGDETRLPYNGGQHPPMREGDVWTWRNAVAAGHGDPVLRDPHAVAADVRAGVYTTEIARETYGVVLGRDGDVDPDATLTERESILTARLGHVPARSPERAGVPDGYQRVGEVLVHRCGRWGCTCGTELGEARSYKSLLVRRVTPGNELGPDLTVADSPLAARMTLREYFCPGCGCRAEAELARDHDEDLDDVVIAR